MPDTRQAAWAAEADIGEVLITEQLSHRALRARDPEKESKALQTLATAIIENPRGILKCLVRLAIELCEAGSAGVSLLEKTDDGQVFRWVALAGAFAPHEGGSTPYSWSPCELCLEKNAPILVSYPERYFTYLKQTAPQIIEGLVVPLRTGRKAAGTIWIVSHDPDRKFDSEDVRIMTCLATFAGVAMHLNASIEAAEREQKRAEESERELADQGRELTRSNADLQQFAYSISHDLQEPLRLVANYTELLERRVHGELAAEIHEFVHTIGTAVHRMKTMIDDLLAYSRLTTDATLTFGETSMNGVLQWSLMNLSSAIRESDATVTSDPLPTVEGDHTQLAQVMQNLIGNAIKYRSQEKPRIHISAEPARGEWVFTVADNGIGVNPKYKNLVFGAFKRLHGREYPGNGIGLAICKRIVERHSGQIWVESEPGKGSKFRFTLPRDR
jgi:signal transduction histidine kinase